MKLVPPVHGVLMFIEITCDYVFRTLHSLSDNQPQQVEKPSVSEPGDSIFSTAADNPASGTSKNSTDDTSSKQFDSLEFPGPRCFDLKRDRVIYIDMLDYVYRTYLYTPCFSGSRNPV